LLSNVGLDVSVGVVEPGKEFWVCCSLDVLAAPVSVCGASEGFPGSVGSDVGDLFLGATGGGLLPGVDASLGVGCVSDFTVGEALFVAGIGCFFAVGSGLVLGCALADPGASGRGSESAVVV